MRIISGSHKGRKIVAPKKLPVRPTTDMAKESLFNIINNHFYFDEISVIDLFAGTGSISYEFASRGSTKITAVDQHVACINFVNQTVDSFGMPIKIVKSDVFKYLEHLNDKSDIIFADPPYNFTIEQFSKIPNLIFSRDLLEEGGILIVEHSKHTDLSGLDHFKYSKGYGGCVFSFFE